MLFRSDSWEVCKLIAALNPKVGIYRSEDGINHGAGASRNLAIRKSNCDFIAFLDADDEYYPGRFTIPRELFCSVDDLDGVYEAVTLKIEDELGEHRWTLAGLASNRMLTLSFRIPSESLFDALVNCKFGSLHLDGLVLKRSIIEKIGVMDEDLPLHQDSAYILKAAALGNLLPGRLDEPVAFWRIHGSNRFSAPKTRSVIYRMKLQYWYTVWKWSLNNVTVDKQEMILLGLINEGRFRTRFETPFPKPFSSLQHRIQLFLLPFLYPELLKQKIFWQVVPLNPKFWIRRWFFGKKPEKTISQTLEK